MGMYAAEPNRTEPDSWKTVSYTVRRPGETAWLEGIKTYPKARREAMAASVVAGTGHCVYRVYAEQEYIGDQAGVPKFRTVEI